MEKKFKTADKENTNSSNINSIAQSKAKSLFVKKTEKLTLFGES